MKGYSSETYGDGAQKTGLVLALVDHTTRLAIAWPEYPPIAPEDIVMPEGWQLDPETGRARRVA